MTSSMRGSVLIVDDIESSRHLLSRQLHRQGHIVTTAENGLQALELLRTEPFDLVLLDIMMPELSGYEVLERMKADAALRHIPVVVVSALTELDSAVRCVKLGAEDYLFKPFNPVLLQARITASLEKKRLRDQERAYQEDLRIMQQIDRELNSGLDLQRVLEITLKWAMEYSKFDAGLIGTVRNGGIVIESSLGYDTELTTYANKPLPFNKLLIGESVETRQPQLQNAAGDDDFCGLLNGAQCCVTVPINREDRVIGIFLLESAELEKCAKETLAFLSRLGAHSAIAISNAQLHAAVQEANVAKSEFVSFVAHELRAPMTAIKGYVDILAEGAVGETNETQARFLDIIRDNVDRMTTLVSDLNDISRIESGYLRLEFSDVCISEVVDEVVRSARGQIEQKKQTLQIQLADGLPAVWGDYTRVGQILTNLLSNAHKYTPEGGEIIIRAEHVLKNEGAVDETEMVHIAVQDNGLGISPEDQRDIFQKFFRADDEMTRDTPGVGLGLNVTKNLVEMQGGEIWFESELRAGSTFHFTIPVASKNETGLTQIQNKLTTEDAESS